MPLPLDRIKGSIPPLITPFRNGEVDYDAYARLVEMQILEGSHGILVNGTTSEPASLTTEERNRLVTLSVEVAKGRVPIVAATGSQAIWETRILTEHAAKAGADALLIVTPYYTRPPQRGMIAYYLEVMKGIDLPWMIYHIPGRAAIDVKIDTVKELRDKSPNFVGMKHASLDLDFVTECLAAAGHDFKIFVGLEELSFPMMAIGACGLMNAVGNLRPRVLADLCEAVWRGDLEDRAGPASPPARSQQGDVLRHQSDPDQIHGEAARHRRRATSIVCRWCRRRPNSKSGSTACSRAPAC